MKMTKKIKSWNPNVVSKVSGFEKYLIENTTLQPSSIIKYVGEVRHYFDNQGVLSIKNLNRHIINKHRRSSNNRTKYAFKHFLEYINAKHAYEHLPRLKTPPRKKLQHFATPAVARKVLRHIPRGKYRDMAILQLASGCRSMEIITIREENVDKDNLTVLILGKGNKTGYVQFPIGLRPILEKYCKGEKGYLFLSENFEKYHKEDPMMFERKIRGVREAYYKNVKRAGKNAGVEYFGTHDLRRAFSWEFYNTLPDVRALKEALRHSNITTTMNYLPEHTERVRETIAEVQGKFFNLKKDEGKG
jgi:integrase